MNSSLPLLAAFAYTFPYYFPEYCWPLIFLFPTLLFLWLTLSTPSNTELFYWSFATIALHLLPICDALIHMAHGPSYLKIIPPLALIFYVSLFLTLWLTTANYLIHKKWCHSTNKQLIIWTVLLWLYLLFIDQGLLWAFGRWEGYMFLNPWLPLAFSPTLLAPLKTISMMICLLIFSLISSLITLFWIRKSTIKYALLFLVIFLWINVSQFNQEEPPLWLETVGHLPLMLPTSIKSNMGAALIRYELENLHQKYPHLMTVIMPESSWNGSALSKVTKLPVLSDLPIKDVIIGSFAQENGNWYNRMYHFYQGELKATHDKRHAMPLAERRVPFTYDLNNQLFFHESPPICASQKARNCFNFQTIGAIIPYICSELFFHQFPDNHSSAPLLASINDWWFRMPHFQKLLALAARVRAVQWSHPILYISFHYAQFFSPTGQSQPIATTPPDRFIQ